MPTGSNPLLCWHINVIFIVYAHHLMRFDLANVGDLNEFNYQLFSDYWNTGGVCFYGDPDSWRHPTHCTQLVGTSVR